MSENRLKISVVIATLNRPDSLRNCLKSLEEQAIPPDEVVIVVDGEPNADVQQTIDFFRNNRKLNITQLDNGRRMGAPYSKNRGGNAASDDIIAFIDDDITLVPDWTVQLIKGYEAYPDAAGVGGMVAMQELTFISMIYEYSVKIRRQLFSKKMGKMNFIGMPYLSLTFPTDNMRIVDLLHGGNMSFRRDIFNSHNLDPTLGVRDEFDVCVNISRREKKKLIYNSKAIAYHHHNPVGGVGLWGNERLYRDFRDHVPYLLKNYNLKYLRLAAFTIAVSGYAAITLKPKYLKAIWEGYKIHRKRKERQTSFDE